MSHSKRTLATLILLLVAICLACSKRGASPEAEAPAVTEAVKTYVKDVKKIEVDNLDVTVKDLKITGDQAECQASFALKKQKDVAFTYSYKLAKKAGKWAVLSSSSAGQGHSGMPGSAAPSAPGGMGAGMPPGHPPMGDANSEATCPTMAGHAPAAEGNRPPPPPAPAKQK